MNTQISRNSFDPDKRYSAIYQQMGRMLTDADWNEFSELEKNRLVQALNDIIGTGTPRKGGIVERLDNGDGTTTDSIKWGQAYVDGVMAQLRPASDAVLSDPAGVAFEYDKQADFPLAPLPVGDHLLYLDVWERTVTMLEDNHLRDPGLNGADTCTRSQTMAQVKWCPLGVEPENEDHNPSIGGALLTLRLREGSTEPDPCDPCANEIALQDKIGNYLFRVELHDVQYDGVGSPTRVTLKWSRENGAEQYAIDDTPVGFASDKWSYEFFSGPNQAFASEKHLGKHLAPGFVPQRQDLIQGYPDSPPAATDLVRRWDGYCVLEKSGTNWTLVEGSDIGVSLSTASAADAHAHLDEGASVSINLDAIALSVDLADNPLLAGDYWQAEVRQVIHTVNAVLIENALPRGIVHHYMTLGQVSGGVFTAYESEDCRRFEFPPLTDIRAEDVCYDNGACDMPGVDTVKDALDHLCKSQDLKWHHKHLHGWGIVCGLIVECCDRHDEDNQDDVVEDDVGANDVVEADGSEQEQEERRGVCVTAGHALTCEGDRVSLTQSRHVDVMDQIAALQEAGEVILDEAGSGSVCLRIDIGDDGEPAISVEAYDAAKHKQSMFDGTLLMDFYQHCILGLVEALKAEFAFLDAGELDTVEGGSTGLVSTQRRKFISVLNLIIQLFNSANGSYIFLSRKEHLILRDIYLSLRELLRSKTFCAMFQDNDFPDYPFPDTGMTTYFGKNNHTRVKAHPAGDRIYTYGGANNTINVFDVSSEELVQVIEMPSAEGAEVTAIAFSADGQTLYAAASVRQMDTVFGIADIGTNPVDEHQWRDMTILCDLEITEMEVATDDEGLLYACGLGKGLFYLRPALFMDDTKPQLTPTYAFNAVGHMALDQQNARAYLSSQTKVATAGVYDQVEVCDLSQVGENQSPTVSFALMSSTGAALSGEDGIAIRPPNNNNPNGNNQDGRLFVVVNGPGTKYLNTYSLPLASDDLSPAIASVSIENTAICLAYHPQRQRVLLGMEDGYRLQAFTANGEATPAFRIPAQIQPTDVIVEPRSGRVYALNFISNTLSAIPADELDVNNAFLNDLAQYRTAILTAFYGLFGGLLQYLKDCFCHHLLVKCPSCDDDVLYLATVEIRDNQVYKICNFDKRKYVKSFPTMGYWFSLVPLWPMLKGVVSKFCCAVLPDLFGGYRDAIIRQPEPLDEQTQVEVARNVIPAKTARATVQTYERTDTRTILRDQGKSLRLGGLFARDSALNLVQSNQRNQAGLKKQVLLQSRTDDAVQELEKNNIRIAEVQEYDATKAQQYLRDYNNTPQRIQPGSDVTLVQKDGKVMYYAVNAPQSNVNVSVPEGLREELTELETRKTSLADLSAINASLAEVEARRASVAEVEQTKSELAAIQAEKATIEAELAAVKSQVDAIRTTRIEEEAKLTEINTQRNSIASEINNLNTAMLELETTRKEIAVNVERQRSIGVINEVDAEIQTNLRNSGILTVDDLAKSDVATLTANTEGLTRERATLLINAANNRLRLFN